MVMSEQRLSQVRCIRVFDTFEQVRKAVGRHPFPHRRDGTVINLHSAHIHWNEWKSPGRVTVRVRVGVWVRV